MKRTQWTVLVGGLLALAGLGGCRQQLFLEPADYKDALGNAAVAKLENQPQDPITPTMLQPASPPATVLDPTRPPRFLTLKEAIAIALEQGTVGGPATTNPGFTQDVLPQFTGQGSSGTDKLQAFAVDPAITGAEIERALSKFDARWINSITWNKVDQPTLTLQQSFSNGDSATLSSTLAKPLPTGGVAGILFTTNYLSLANPPTNSQFVTLATSYTPRVQFIFEQPLLQGFGVEINQLLPNHPGSTLIQGLRPSGGQGSAGILVTRIRNEQQRAEFDRLVNIMLLNVETAYWNLYAAYHNLAAQEEGLKQSLDAFAFARQRALGGLFREQLAWQNQANFHRFQAQVLTARGQVLSSERQLRGLLGMRSDDGTRLVPIDEPTQVPFRPDYYEVANDALQFRPELTIARQELKARQMDLILQRNLRRPDVRFFSSYDIAGLGPRLDGSGTTTTGAASTIQQNALASLALNQFNSWTLGLRADIPLGFRDANALSRQAQLNLRKAYIQLLDAERKSVEVVAEQYRQVILNNDLIKYRRAERLALQQYVRLDEEIRAAGAFTREEAPTFIFNLVNVQQQLATATGNEFQAIAQYNIALANLEFARGTIQRYNNVTVADGPLPGYVGKKASDHFREREVALKLREHPADVPGPKLTQYQPMTNLPPLPPELGGPPAIPGAQPGSPWVPINPAPAAPGTEQAPAPKTTIPGLPAPLPLGGTGGPAAMLPAPPPTAPASGDGSGFTPIGVLTFPKKNGGVPAGAATTPLPTTPTPTSTGSGSANTPSPVAIPIAPPTR